MRLFFYKNTTYNIFSKINNIYHLNLNLVHTHIIRLILIIDLKLIQPAYFFKHSISRLCVGGLFIVLIYVRYFNAYVIDGYIVYN